MKRIIDDTLLEKYFQITAEALAKAEKAPHTSDGEICIDMAKRYYDDARHFRDKQDCVLAYGALNYAHGWLDCGARLGLFKVNDSRLFTVDE